MKCPGQDSRYWKPGAIFEVECPNCRNEVEFFKDDTTRLCKKCGHRFVNPEMDFGCASYCPYAEQCLGDLPLELLAERDDLLKDRVAIEMKHYFGHDFKRIGHAANVARYAEHIVREEHGNPAVVLCAAYLHDIGIHEAGRRCNNTAARNHEKEGPPIARNILAKLGAREEIIEEVCDIIGHHHHPRDEETLNFKIVYDADLIANLEGEQKERKTDKERLGRIIEKKMFTHAGKRLADTILLGEER
ncbi:MAG: HD domain-containing protein [Thermodesulfobacteriota bacterium]|nr:HD domain-containing protein [Thermodesulfobacteriota bacterium]